MLQTEINRTRIFKKRIQRKDQKNRDLKKGERHGRSEKKNDQLKKGEERKIWKDCRT